MSVLQQILALISKHYYNMADLPKSINQNYLSDEIQKLINDHKNDSLMNDDPSVPDLIVKFIQAQLAPPRLVDHSRDPNTDRLLDDLYNIFYHLQ